MENESVPEGPGDETVSNLDICFHCGQAGNWKKNCSEFLQLKAKVARSTCYYCRQTGHLMNYCKKFPEAKVTPFLYMIEINMSVRNRNMGTKQKRVIVNRGHRGAKIAEYVESEGEDDGSKNDLPSSPEVSKVQEALKASPLELQALVMDPLPDALGMAENDKGATNLPNPTGTGSVEEPVETEGRNQSVGHQNNLPEHSTMESNGTVRNYEVFQQNVDDSIEGLPGETSNHPSRTHLLVRRERLFLHYRATNYQKLRRGEQCSDGV